MTGAPAAPIPGPPVLSGRSWVVAIGASAGGVAALPIVLSALPSNFPAAVLVVQHLNPDARSYLAGVLQRRCALPVRNAVADAPIELVVVYVAPPGTHLLLRDGRIVLTDTARVHYSRPSIDVLFDSIAAAYGPRAVGVILTGSGADGAAGLLAISRAGGRTIVQEPATAEFSAMPSAAGATGGAEFTLPLSHIGPALTALVEEPHD